MQEEQKIPTGEQFSMIADTAPVLIRMSDAHQSCCYCNKGWLDFTGRTASQEYGNAWAEHIHADDTERCRALLKSSADKREPYQLQYRLLRQDGQYRWLLENGVPRFAEDGGFLGYISSCMDIHNIKETEAAKDQFIGIAGHELKTPLTTLMVSTQMLGKLFQSDPTSHYIPELIQTSVSSLKKLEILIDDLLNVGVVEDGHMQLRKTHFKLDQLILECLDSFKLTVDKKFVIQGHADITLYADAKKMEQVLMNLLNNALKYAPASAEIDIILEETGHFITLTVKDFGPGIAPENLPFIFDRYFRGARKNNKEVPGFGLGLYISREIIRQHGGDMGVDSKPGEGSAFWFSVPLDDTVQN